MSETGMEQSPSPTSTELFFQQISLDIQRLRTQINAQFVTIQKEITANKHLKREEREHQLSPYFAEIKRIVNELGDLLSALFELPLDGAPESQREKRQQLTKEVAHLQFIAAQSSNNCIEGMRAEELRDYQNQCLALFQKAEPLFSQYLKKIEHYENPVALRLNFQSFEQQFQQFLVNIKKIPIKGLSPALGTLHRNILTTVDNKRKEFSQRFSHLKSEEQRSQKERQSALLELRKIVADAQEIAQNINSICIDYDRIYPDPYPGYEDRLLELGKRYNALMISLNDRFDQIKKVAIPGREDEIEAIRNDFRKQIKNFNAAFKPAITRFESQNNNFNQRRTSVIRSSNKQIKEGYTLVRIAIEQLGFSHSSHLSPEQLEFCIQRMFHGSALFNYGIKTLRDSDYTNSVYCMKHDKTLVKVQEKLRGYCDTLIQDYANMFSALKDQTDDAGVSVNLKSVMSQVKTALRVIDSLKILATNNPIFPTTWKAKVEETADAGTELLSLIAAPKTAVLDISAAASDSPRGLTISPSSFFRLSLASPKAESPTKLGAEDESFTGPFTLGLGSVEAEI